MNIIITTKDFSVQGVEKNFQQVQEDGYVKIGIKVSENTNVIMRGVVKISAIFPISRNMP